MPFADVKIAGPALGLAQIAHAKGRDTAWMAEVLGKFGPPVDMLSEDTLRDDRGCCVLVQRHRVAAGPTGADR